MDSVEDMDNEEAVVEDEPEILHGHSHDGPSNENQAFIQGNIIHEKLCLYKNCIEINDFDYVLVPSRNKPLNTFFFRILHQ